MKVEINDEAIPLPYDFRADVLKTVEISSNELGLDNVDVTVSLSFFPRSDGEATAFGEFTDAENKYGINVNPISGMQWPDIIQRLCHEFVHIKQIVDGDLKFEGEDAIWQGTIFKGFDINNPDNPWEKDADVRGDTIFEKVKQQAMA